MKRAIFIIPSYPKRIGLFCGSDRMRIVTPRGFHTLDARCILWLGAAGDDHL